MTKGQWLDGSAFDLKNMEQQEERNRQQEKQQAKGTMKEKSSQNRKSMQCMLEYRTMYTPDYTDLGNLANHHTMIISSSLISCLILSIFLSGNAFFWFLLLGNLAEEQFAML